LEDWDDYIYKEKTKQTLGAYYLLNGNNKVYEYIVAANSVAFESQ